MFHVITADETTLTHPHAETIIQVAEARVRYATRHAYYPTDRQGNPTGNVLVVLRRAVLMQVEAWEAAGLLDDVVAGGAVGTGGQVKSASDNGVTVTYDYGIENTARARLLTGLAPGVEAYLAGYGLLGGLPGVVR